MNVYVLPVIGVTHVANNRRSCIGGRLKRPMFNTALRVTDRATIHAGTWSLAFSSPRTHRSSLPQGDDCRSRNRYGSCGSVTADMQLRQPESLPILLLNALGSQHRLDAGV